jgi:formylglycine-generating enzyme required for sulfatase activity
MRIKKRNVLGIVAAVTLSAASVASFIAEAGRQDRSRSIEARVQMTRIASGSFTHPLPGEFLKDGRPVVAPRILADIGQPFEIMTYQVSLAEYGRCVDAGVCKTADARGKGDVPVTGVSYLDATEYARWYSRTTGETWRLPTDKEWAFAAGERFRGDMEPLEEDPRNPARGWLSSYQREVDLARKPDPEPKVRGSFGVNAKGIADVAGNIWEWTSTCYVRTTISEDGERVESAVESCGVHVVAGFHRTYMSNFIRDGKSGGCAIGLPPDNLGFRLIREPQGFLGFLAFGRGHT